MALQEVFSVPHFLVGEKNWDWHKRFRVSSDSPWLVFNGRYYDRTIKMKHALYFMQVIVIRSITLKYRKVFFKPVIHSEKAKK